MSIKTELRKELKSKRSNLTDKKEASNIIQNKLLSSKLYSKCNAILCYSSLNDEVNTNRIIKKSLLDSKAVALPYCIDNNGTMEFYVVNSLDDLIEGSFGVKEPDISKCKKLISFDNAIIVVPALAFDKQGYRLGYGKGYYDRFLEKHHIKSIGLCYNDLIQEELPTDRFDLPVNYIITEKQVITCDNGGKNGKFE